MSVPRRSAGPPRPASSGGQAAPSQRPPLQPPSQEYLSPDPYPEENDEPLVGEEYREEDIVDDPFDTSSVTAAAPAPAPVPIPAQQTHTKVLQPKQKRGSITSKPTHPTQPLSSSSSSAAPSSSTTTSTSTTASSTAAADPAAAQPSAARPRRGSTSSKPRAAAAAAPLAATTAAEVNPFDTPAPERGNAAVASAPAATISKSASPPPSAMHLHESAESAVPASTSPTSSSLPKSGSLSKMNELLSSGLAGIERHSDKMIRVMRGIDEEAENKREFNDTLMESLDYDKTEDYMNQIAVDDNKMSAHVLTLLQLLLTVAIALATAAAMYCVSHLVEYCMDRRVETTLELIQDGQAYGAYFAFLSISMLLAGISTILVTYFAPHAKGGGVPYVQAYLNGTNVASYFSPRIVFIKIAALGFTIASGLSLGMEGPFVFIGSGIAIILSKALDLFSFRQRLGGKYARILKNINEERVFMAGGMAAGLAVAFNAPIAGVLMALEGSTAFLTVPVVLRIFGCAMFATFFNDLGHANFSVNIKTHNIIQITTQPDAPDFAWVISEILCFAIISVLGGLIGALGIWINVKMTKWRHHHVEPHPPHNKLNTTWAIGEVLFLVFITATTWFVLPYMFGCRMQHEQCFPTIAVPKKCMPIQCPDKYYSEIGTIIYSSSDTVARILFDRTLLPVNDLQPFPLVIYAAFYMSFVSVLYGAHVPGGLFVPSVVVGGCMGRVVGWVVHTYISSTVNPGVYALLGAASMFGGFTRLALPAVIMLIEMTGDATYLLPIMFCTVLAKVVSDEIVPPLYPQHMAIEGLPTLGDKLNPLIAPLNAKQIMNRNFYSVRQYDTLKHILDVLDKSRSILLPVTTQDGKFVGMIKQRSVIYAALYATKYASENEIEDASLNNPTSTSLQGTSQSATLVEKKMGGWDDTTDYTEKLEEAVDQTDDKYANAVINLTPYMDAGALTAHEATSAKRIAAIFRRLGLSHLAVSDQSNKLVGVITRRHLIKPPAAAPAVAIHRVRQENGLSPDSIIDMEASPDGEMQVVLDQSAVLNTSFAQRRSFRRQGSILTGSEPVVKFDDEEDEEPEVALNDDEAGDSDDQEGNGFVSPQDMHANLYDAGLDAGELEMTRNFEQRASESLRDYDYVAPSPAEEAKHSRKFREATGGSFDRQVSAMLAQANRGAPVPSPAQRGRSGSEVMTQTASPVQLHRKPKSALSRLSVYSKQL